MSAQIKDPSIRIPSYYQNNSLLLQFILFEFVTSYHETVILKQLAASLKSPPSNEHLNETLRQLSIHIVKLSGCHDELKKNLPWDVENGMLSKLKNYCLFYSRNATQSNQTIILYQTVHQAWIHCLNSINIIKVLQLLLMQKENPLNFSSDHLIPLLKHIGKIHYSIRQASRSLNEIIPQFRHDENLIFFLVRNHKQFKELYGSKFAAKLIIKMYPKGLDEVRDFLHAKYKDRKFDHLLPIISQKISELKLAKHE